MRSLLVGYNTFSLVTRNRWSILAAPVYQCLLADADSSSLPCRWLRRVLFLTRFFFLSFFFLSFFLLSGNTSFSHTSLHPILTKLSQSDRYLDHYSGTDNGGVRGHDGVTWVKNVIFTKKASSPTEYLALMRDLCICISLTPSTKVYGPKNSSGVHLGSRGSKGHFHQKGNQVLQNT